MVKTIPIIINLVQEVKHKKNYEKAFIVDQNKISGNDCSKQRVLSIVPGFISQHTSYYAFTEYLFTILSWYSSACELGCKCMTVSCNCFDKNEYSSVKPITGSIINTTTKIAHELRLSS